MITSRTIGIVMGKVATNLDTEIISEDTEDIHTSSSPLVEEELWIGYGYDDERVEYEN